MTRILILIVLAWLLYQIIKRVIANIKAQDSTQKSQQDADINQDEKMLQCAQCGCHVPESNTKVVNEKIICNNPECNKARSDKSSHVDWFICQDRQQYQHHALA